MESSRSGGKYVKYEDQYNYTNLSLETPTPLFVEKRTTGETTLSTKDSRETTLSHSESRLTQTETTGLTTDGTTLLLADESVLQNSDSSFGGNHSL